MWESPIKKGSYAYDKWCDYPRPPPSLTERKLRFTRVGATSVASYAGRFAFQFTRPNGRDKEGMAPTTRETGFNSRARVGATRGPFARRTFATGFNSRARVGATRPNPKSSHAAPVSIHAPGWARQDHAARASNQGQCFNSRARVGATLCQLDTPGGKEVSIHAPGWARPRAPSGGQGACGVSIHAPGWARRGRPPRRWARGRRFNSRARVGATFRNGRAKPCVGCFNSRARVGATFSTSRIIRRSISFNSRARVGATSLRNLLRHDRQVSIHAPGWARRHGLSRNWHSTCFNSRARVGATRRKVQELLRGWVSIHAPGWARRKSKLCKMYVVSVSIHAPGWARPAEKAFNIRKHGMFQFTRPGGRDFILAGGIDGKNVSIHAPGWARHEVFFQQPFRRLVSIHAPGWARPVPSRPRSLLQGVSIHAPGWARHAGSRGRR